MQVLYGYIQLIICGLIYSLVVLLYGVRFVSIHRMIVILYTAFMQGLPLSNTSSCQCLAFVGLTGSPYSR